MNLNVNKIIKKCSTKKWHKKIKKKFYQKNIDFSNRYIL